MSNTPSPYDHQGIAGLGADMTLFEYWYECRMFRVYKTVTPEVFSGCMVANTDDDTDIPFHTRQKMKRYVAAEIVAA
jgi:hypothetical protein